MADISQGNGRLLVRNAHRHPAETITMSIYIARGDDTLGPYTPADAAELIARGYLSPDDFAARNGDAAWVPLSSLLPAITAPQPAQDVRITSPARVLRRPRLLAATAVVLALLAAGLPLIFRRAKDGRATRRLVTPPPPAAHVLAPVARATPVASSPSPPIIVSIPSPPVVVSTPSPPMPPPPVEEPGGQLRGTVSLAATGELAAVRVSAYRLETLRQYVAQKQTAAQAELDRIAPLLAAAETERKTRVATEQSALQAFNDADSSDDLRPSLQFAYVQAKSATKAAGVDCDYYLDQRRAVTSGEFYFQDLPAPLATAETNERGEFDLDLPPGGPFAVAASARQVTAEGTTQHYWMVKASVADPSRPPLSLSDQNDSSTTAAESLIHTESP